MKHGCTGSVQTTEKGTQMASSEGTAFAGTLSYDVTPIASIIVNLPPGVAGDLRTVMPGVEDALDELSTNLTVHGASIEISSNAAQSISTYTTNIAQIEAALKVVGPLYLALTESLAKYVHDREVLVAQIAKAAKSAAKAKNPALLTPFKVTVAYHGQVGEKAAKTRKKNAEAAAQGVEVAPPKKGKKAAAKKAAPEVEAPQQAEAIRDEETPPPSLRAA